MLALGAAEAVVANSLDDATQNELIENYINRGGCQLMSDRSNLYADAFFAVLKAEGGANEVADELFRFARVLEGNDELRQALTDPHLPVEPPPADRRGPPRRQGHAHSPARLVSMVVGHRPGRASSPRSSTGCSTVSAAAGKKVVAEVRSAVALTDDQKSRLAAALGQEHRQAGRGHGRSSTPPCSAASSPRSATPSSTAPCASVSSQLRESF